MTVGGYFQRCFASLSDLSRRAPLFAKTRDIFVIYSARETARHGWQCKSAASVGVVDGDGLFCIREVSHNALREYIEWATEENFVGG